MHAHNHQIIALDRLFDPVAKFSHTIRVAGEIPQRIARAIQIAAEELPGAVHLSLPEDVARGPAEGAAFTPLDTAMPQPDPRATRDLAKRLAQAQRPILLAGAGVLRAGAAAALRDFADATGMALATSFMGKGLLPLDHGSYLGTFGLPVEDHVDRAIAAADFLLLVGLDPVEYPVATLNPDAVTAAIAAAPLPRDASPALVAEAVGDPGQSLTAIKDALQGKRWGLHPDFKGARDAMLKERAALSLDADTPSAPALCRAIETVVPDDTLILSGVGTHKLALARNLHPDRPGRMIIPNGLAGMGLALPGAVAAARLDPDRPVFAVCGDGDVMMNLQEMETATRLGVALTVMVWVDGGYGLIEDKQEKSTGTRPALSFSDIGWGDLATAFGWTHLACATADEARRALADGVSARGRRLLTVPVRYSGKLA